MLHTRADVGIVAGDLTSSRGSSSSEELNIKSLLAKAAKPVLFLMGNDDRAEWMSQGNLVNIDQKQVRIGAHQFVGYQYTNPFIGGIFDRTEELQERDLAALKPAVMPNSVLITHGPPRGILDLTRSQKHVGSVALKKFVDLTDPLVHIFGHIHESHGVFGKFVNVSYPVSRSCCLIELPNLKIKFIRQ